MPAASDSTRAAEIALVEVEARLLADVARERPRDAALLERRSRRALAADDALALGEALGLRGAGRRSVDDRARLEDLAERLEDHRLAILHPEREDLDDEDVAEAIDDEPGDAVALRMHDAIAGRLGRGAEAELLAGRRARARTCVRKNAVSMGVVSSRTRRRTGIAEPGE